MPDRLSKIQCVGPRIPETWNGKNVALENDLCICRCQSAPKLLPNQNLRCQVIKDAGRALSHPVAAAVARGAPTQVFTDRFVLVDEHDGTPLARREYAVVRASGKPRIRHLGHAWPYPPAVDDGAGRMRGDLCAGADDDRLADLALRQRAAPPGAPPHHAAWAEAGVKEVRFAARLQPKHASLPTSRWWNRCPRRTPSRPRD
ncbi:hypothetical protein LP420_09775 [Massilia sp. B-10]|nr:hypothetical protein LP420_09775 [Massilia sp. B-10]